MIFLMDVFFAIRAGAIGWIRPAAVLCLAGLTLTAQAAVPLNLRFENMGAVAKNATIAAIVQDKSGYIWLGSTNGLFRYDGYEQVEYKNVANDPNSLPSNNVLALLKGNRETLWVGTAAGLVSLNLESGHITRYSLKPTSPLSNIVHKIISDGKNGLWLATRGGLQHFDPDSGRFLEYKHDPSRPESIATDNINTVTLDDKGGLWLATWPGGVDYLAPGSSVFLHYRVDFPSEPDPQMNNIRDLHFDSRKRLWIVSEAGIAVWQAGSSWSNRKHLDIPPDATRFRVNKIFEDQYARIWLAGHAGLLVWDDEKNQLVRHGNRAANPMSLPSENIFSVFVDQSEILWLGTESFLVKCNLGIDGIEHFVPNDFSRRDSNKLISNLALSVAGDIDGQAWIGSANGLLLANLNKRAIVKEIKANPHRSGSLKDNNIFSLYRERNGILWVGSMGGLQRYNPATGHFRSVEFEGISANYILRMAPGSKGVLWLGTGDGITRYNTTSGSTRRFRHDPADPYSRIVSASFAVLEDRGGRVWVGGGINGGGLDVLDQSTGKFKNFRHDPQNPASLSNDQVYCLFEDKQGSLWVGTGKGLNRLILKPDGSIEFQKYHQSKIASEWIASINADNDDNIWVGTVSSGLYKINLNTHKIIAFPLLNGFLSNFHSTSYRDSQDQLYLGNSNGLIRVISKEANFKSFPPKAAITDITIAAQLLNKFPYPKGVDLKGSITRPEALKLSWDKATFAIGFSSLHFADVGANKYQYQLEGFDKDWVHAGTNHRQATYTNLDHGNYVFHLKTSNNMDQWDEITLPIIITPPFWVTWWFRILVLGLLLLLGAILFRWRMRQHIQNEARLEALVAKRSAEAIQLRDEAIAANEAKSEFLANMSHEIRTPMNSILGMAHLALNSDISSKSRNYLEKIRLSGLHLLGIIEEILDFSKVSAGKLRLEKTDFDLIEVLESANILFAERAKEKGLNLVSEIDPSLPTILCGDPLRLGQVLVNYISNAIKFTQSGSVSIRIRKIDENESGLLVRFEVQDTGIGINDTDKEKLFQPFQQADTSTTRQYGGTGLGLAISRQMVELMEEGKVGLESIPGKGSTFWFSVRLGKGCPNILADNPPATSLPSVLPIFDGSHILVAEDHPLNQEVITDILENAGAVVHIAQNGKEALDLLGQRHFDCVLMDLQMPVMDGLEAIRVIRANPAWANMPVIALTANASKSQCDRCLEAGMDDFIGKPFDPAMFYATIAKWLNWSKQEEPLSAITPMLSQKTKWKGGSNILDLSTLAEWNGGEKLKMRKFALKFLASARQDMAEIESALEHNNLETLGKLAHHNKSPALMVGAKEFINLCHALEELSETKGSMEQAREILSQMRLALDRINKEVDKELA